MYCIHEDELPKFRKTSAELLPLRFPICEGEW